MAGTLWRNEEVNTGIVPPHMTTGGNNPPIPSPTNVSTGGNLPPTPNTATAPTPTVPVRTGGNLPPTPVPTVGTGGNNPPVPLPNTVVGQNYVATARPPTGTAPGTGSVVQGINNQFANPNLPGHTNVALDSLNQILDSGNPYMQNAARRGREMAGARGLMNSSIAAGASQRAALESAMPILGHAMGLNSQREGQNFQSLMQSRNQTFDLTKSRENNAFTAQENQLDRVQNVNNQMLAAELRKGGMVDEAKLQNWLNNESYTRQFNGNLAMMPIQSAADLTNYISQMAMQDPELYTPEIVSGMTEFFHNNMLAIMQQYFGGA